ncbi:MAG: hypothetical protein J6Q53_07870 [Oscillospiraceae bacterium]|nr:hypothetical protein [Oscillospiraceae bacterium]
MYECRSLRSFQRPCTVLSGRLISNWIVDAVTVTITGSDGTPVQWPPPAQTGVKIGREYTFEMGKFETDKPATIRGSIDLQSLPPETYNCKVVCCLSKDAQTFTVREFAFSVVGK